MIYTLATAHSELIQKSSPYDLWAVDKEIWRVHHQQHVWCNDADGQVLWK